MIPLTREPRIRRCLAGAHATKLSRVDVRDARGLFPGLDDKVRRTYTQSHVDYVIEVCAAVAERRTELRGLRMTFEPPSLRHFTARFEPVDA